MTCPADLLAPELRAFLRGFHAENGGPDPAARLREVAAAGWEPTAAELTWGAKVAWRNSVRCVGRLYWEALEVRDLRGLGHFVQKLRNAGLYPQTVGNLPLDMTDEFRGM